MNSLQRFPMIDELLHCSVLNLFPISPKKCVRPDVIYSLSSDKWKEIFNFPVATRIEFLSCFCKQQKRAMRLKLIILYVVNLKH